MSLQENTLGERQVMVCALAYLKQDLERAGLADYAARLATIQSEVAAEWNVTTQSDDARRSVEIAMNRVFDIASDLKS